MHADEGLAGAAALLRAGEYAAAERRLKDLAARSVDAAVWLHLGAAQHALGKLQEANASFAKAVQLDPVSPHAYCAQATILSALGRTAEAEAVLRKAPDDAQVDFNLAVLLEQRGEAAAARSRYGQALLRDPGHAGARMNLGAAKLEGGDAHGALEDFDALVARSPSADAHANRARALLALFRDPEALEAAGEALALDAGHATARLDRAAALASLGRLEEADRAMPPAEEVLVELRARGFSEAPRALDLYLARAFGRQSVCDWHDRSMLMRYLRAALRPDRESMLSDAALPFNALSLPLSAAEQRTLAESVGGSVKVMAAPYVPKARRGGKARIGFLSANVAAHPEGYLLRRVLGGVNRQTFEVRLYALNAHDGSQVADDLRSACDAFIDLSKSSSAQVIDQMRAHELELMVETSGTLRGTRPPVLKARVAPIQASYLSVPATMGGALVDYRISDAGVTPAEMQGDWPERLVLLQETHFAYDNGIRAGAPGSRSQHALPDNGVVLCCMNQAFKIEPEAFGVWMRVLAAVPGAALWLLDEGSIMQANLRREAQARGVEPQRLIFAPRVPLEEHLGRLQHADLFLDTFCCNAHTTALDALWAGVPLLTRRGTTMASRIASTFVRSVGLTELIVDTTDDYESRALQLARDPAALQRLKATLAQSKACAPVFDTPARVRALERAFTAMVERHRAGLPPDTLIIE